MQGFAVAVMVVAVSAAPAPVYPDRPAPAHTGGFGEPTCLACHFDGDLNPPGGTLATTGWPDRVVPGRAYPITVTLMAPGMERAGFQLAVRTPAGAQAGRLRPADARTAVTDSAGVAYIQHSAAGSRPATPGVAEWRFRWIPAGRGGAVVHLAANAANGDASALGDAIYADSTVIGG